MGSAADSQWLQNCALPPSLTPAHTELVIITGLSGSGKGTVLKALEDLGYYSVDNLPIDLIPKFAELAEGVPNIRKAAIVVDIREGRFGAGAVSGDVQEAGGAPVPVSADLPGRRRCGDPAEV